MLLVSTVEKRLYSSENNKKITTSVTYTGFIHRGIYMNLNCRFRDAKSTQNPVPAACIITVFQQGN